MELVKSWLSKWKWKGATDEFLEYWFKEEGRVDERVVSTIRELKEKDIKCCLATNQEKYRTHYMKDKMGFAELFDHVFSSADIGHKKPDKEFYKSVLNEIEYKYRIYPNEVAFFDDSEDNVREAKELNMSAYVYNDFDNFRKTMDKISLS
ncbi:MAG: HAD-IA family hydrolase [Patescibacteria group bacterium]